MAAADEAGPGAPAGAAAAAGAGSDGATTAADKTASPRSAGKSEAAANERFMKWLEQWPPIVTQMTEFITKLKRREFRSEYDVAKTAAVLLRNTIGTCKSMRTVGEALDNIRRMGKMLIAAQPLELVVGNIVRRVLHILREEGFSASKARAAASTASTSVEYAGMSLQTILEKKDGSYLEMSFKELRFSVIDGVTELIDELENMYTPITEQALDHIHANEVILTFGKSRAVAEFLKAAAKRRKFEVIVAESAPGFSGHDTALDYAKAGIPTTVINDTAVFAIMARVNKVIVGTHAVMANGGLITHSGAHALALAAKHHSVPLVCVTGLFKLCPLYPHDQDTFNDIVSPTQVLSFEEADYMDKVDVINPEFDYVPPELVNLFISNAYGAQPSYVYRLLAEYYSPEDYVL